MKRKLPKNYLFRVAFPLFYGTVIYILILLVFENFDAVLESFFNKEWLFTVLLTYLSAELLHFFSIFLSKRLKIADKIVKYIVFQIGITILAEFLLVFIAIHIYFTRVEGFSVYFAELVVFELFYLFSVLLYNLFIFSFLLLNEENTLQNEQEEALTKKNEYLIEALKTEMDPDVLYTVMESLLIYIHTDENASVDMINRLSELYRYRLENKYHELIPVNQERLAIENLLHLFNDVYTGSIGYDFPEKPEGDKYLILPVWLQKIIFTVLKCNIISPMDKFVLSFDYQENSLVIKHSYREKILCSEEAEIMKYASDFKFYTNRLIKIQTDDEYVTLTIPLYFANLISDNAFEENETLNEMQ